VGEQPVFNVTNTPLAITDQHHPDPDPRSDPDDGPDPLPTGHNAEPAHVINDGHPNINQTIPDNPNEPRRSTRAPQPLHASLQSTEYRQREVTERVEGQEWATDHSPPKHPMLLAGQLRIRRILLRALSKRRRYTTSPAHTNMP
jgi:hypothetical protein